jgi:hypothetical protein
MSRKKLPANVIPYRPPAEPPGHAGHMMLDGHQRLLLIDLLQKMWSQTAALAGGIELVLDIARRDDPPSRLSRGPAVIVPITGTPPAS